MKKTLLILFLLSGTAANAQVFPVQANPQLMPPYSPYLSDYTAPGSQNFSLQIRANDITLTNYPCRLRITIEGAGITIRTKQNFIPKPLILQGGGIPEIFYGEDLLEYFNPDALDFSGFPRSEYDKSARLPEGVYRFTIEVLDYYRGTVVSNKGTAMAWIMLNDPPLLNLPANHSKMKVDDPTNILFTWTPRHSASPNAAFTTAYVFKLVEIWPGDRNPNDAFLTTPPLFETTTSQNQLLYSVGEPVLIPGRRYAWQVTAHDTGGKDLFKNKGQSEVFVFQFGEELAVPQNLQLRWAKPATLAIRWDAVKQTEQELKYRLKYRPRKRTPGDEHEWYETRTKFTEKTLYDLQPDTEYEVKVRTESVTQESEFTETEIFKTLPETEGAFICRDNVMPPPLPEHSTPRFPLGINDTIHAGGYHVLVRDVMEVGGKYFGSGVAIVPWFNRAKVRVTFENISVNDRFWLTKGSIKSVWKSDSRFMQDVETPVAAGNAAKAGEVDITVVAVDTLITVESGSIAAVTKDERGNIVITTTADEVQVLPKGESYAVADELGNGYVVDKAGNIAKTTASEARAAAARGDRTYDLTFEFVKGESQFGFDEKRLDALSRYYQQLEDGTYVAWKSLATSRPDRLEGHLKSGDIDPRRIRFEVGSSQVMPLSSAGRNFTLNLQGRAAGMQEELLAWYSPGDTLKDHVLGKINLAVYNLIRYQLVIVPVNGGSLPAGLSAEGVAEGLNTVYRQAVVEWNVTLGRNIEVPLGETFDEGETGVFSNYTSDMKKVLNAYGRFQANTFYLFLISKPRNPSTLGYMPRNRQAGFIFVEPHEGNAGEFLKTIAHELGHGAFNLKHTFSEHALPLGTTDNLMDYNSGTALCKYQWDAIHDPQTVLGLFDEEGENALANMTEEQIHAWWNELPPYRKAAEILREHLEDTGVFKNVTSTCDADKCLITATFNIGEDVSYTMETTFLSTTSADELLSTLAFEYRVDLWEALDMTSEDAWDDLYHWWMKQNDDLVQHKGWQASTINFLADVITASTMVPAVQGWITGKHWRDGHELSGWEQALAALDFMAAEEMTKGCITNMVVKVGTKTINLLKIPRAARALISESISNGYKLTVVSGTEFILKGIDGTQLARIADNTFYLLHNGKEIAIDLTKRTAILGRYVEGTEKFVVAKFKNYKLFHMLDIEGWQKVTAPYGTATAEEAFKNAQEFWELYNQNFIDDVITNGDEIVLLSKPDDLTNLFYRAPEGYNYVDINGDIINASLTGNIDKDIRILLSKNAFPTMYGREILYLAKKLEWSVDDLTLRCYK